MNITKIIGASNDDQCAALRQVLAIWERGGDCSAELLARIPTERVEINIESDDDPKALAIIVIEDGIVGFHPLDEPLSDVIH
jgi:hypothetical protein